MFFLYSQNRGRGGWEGINKKGTAKKNPFAGGVRDPHWLPPPPPRVPVREGELAAEIQPSVGMPCLSWELAQNSQRINIINR